MRRGRTISMILSCMIIALASLEVGSIASVAHAFGSQTPQIRHPWTDALSGTVWARLNHLQNNYSLLDPAQARARFGSFTSNLPSVPDPPSLFTNNFRVTGDSSLFPLEDEPSIAVRNQTGQILMVVGANSLSTGLMVSYVSSDQGTTWAGPVFLPLSRNNDTFASDPALGVDRTGTFYYAFLSLFAPSASATTSDDVVVATSPNGVQWTNRVAVQRRTFPITSPIRAELFDKDYLAIGPSTTNLSSDAVYVTYTDFIDYCASGTSVTCNEKVNSTIMEVHSIDRGSTWSSPVAVGPTATASAFSMTGRLVEGSMPAVATNGNLYIAYYDSGPNGWLNASASVMIARSTDNGASFPLSTQAAMIPRQLTYASLAGFRWWSSMFPSIDVAPDGTVYIAYGARQSVDSTDPADLYLVTSTNGGATWGLPVRINDPSSQNGSFFAWLKVSSDGVVHIIWGDQRLDPVGLGYDIFYATAPHDGTKINGNSRVTDVGTDPLFTVGFIGDYFNMAVSGNQVYPVWTDGRRAIRPVGREIVEGETDIYTARLGPRDTPSIVIGSSVPAGYFAPVTVSGSGLPREAYFVMTMSGIPVASQGSGIVFFFSTKSGTLSDTIVPNTNYYGSYAVELDEWLSGAQLATTTLNIANNGSFQSLSNLANAEQTLTIIVGILAAAALVLQVLQLIRRRTGPPQTSPTSAPPSPPLGGPTNQPTMDSPSPPT